MRLILCLLSLAAVLGISALSTSAWAQMAAPTLVPATSGVIEPILTRTPTFVPVNPAVMSWRTDGVGGGGIARANSMLTSGGQTIKIEFEDTYGGYLYAGDTYALGVQYFHETSSGAFLLFEGEGMALALSRRFGGSTAVGLSYSTDAGTQTSDGVTKTDIGSLKVGASFRFADALYVGAIVGRESVKRTEVGDSQNDWNGDRPVSGAGIAYVNNGPWRMHVEASMEQHGDVGNVGDVGSSVTRSDKQQSLLLEGGRGLWVFGLNLVRRSELTDFGPANSTLTSDSREFTVGIMPEKRMALLFHYASADLEVKDPGSTTKVTSVSRALTALWTF